MAKTILTDAYIAINGTAWSDHANNVEITDTADDVEVTSFSPSSYKEFMPGMKDATAKITFFNDWAAGTASIGYALQTLYTAGGTFGLEVRQTSGNASTANPKYTMTGRLYSFTGVSGKVGDVNSTECTVRNAGTAGLTWGTS
jgi:hypothetical protein